MSVGGCACPGKSLNSFSSAWAASGRSCETAWGFWGMIGKSTIPGRFHISLASITVGHLGHMLHCALYLWPVYLNWKGALNKSAFLEGDICFTS